MYIRTVPQVCRWPLTLMLVVAACFDDPIQNIDTGNDAPSDSTDAGDGDGDGDPGDGDGDGGPQCVPLPPNGWQGPVALSLGATPDALACDAAWPVDQATGGVGNPAGPHNCAPCSCGMASGGACPPSAQVARHPNDPGCANPAVETFDATTQCQSFGGAKGGYVRGLAPVPISGSCPPLGGDPINPMPPFGQFGKVCGLSTQPPDCAEGVTVPAFEQPGDWATCIWQDGDLPSCPPGSDYSSGPFVIADMFEDTRVCGDCACTVPIPVCSNYITLLFSAGGCGGAAVGIVSHDGTCSPMQYTVESWRMQNDPVVATEGTCTAQGGGSVGSVMVQHQKTLCCL